MSASCPVRGGTVRRKFAPTAILMGWLLAAPSGGAGRVLGQTPPPAPAYVPAATAGAAVQGIEAAATVRLSSVQALDRAHAARREAKRLEAAGSPSCVDRYYEATAFAYAAQVADVAGRSRWPRAAAEYNQNLADCLRTAGCYGRLDPRSHLQIEGPAGTFFVRVVHRGFVWSSLDFEHLLDARDAPRNPSQHRTHRRAGLGTPQVAWRTNRRQSTTDRHLPERTYFPATAVLRPTLAPWLHLTGTDSAGDVLELHDPLRTTELELADARVPLASDLDAPLAHAALNDGGRQSALLGLFNPSAEIAKASLNFFEPYQPNKIVIVFVHGLSSSPYTFCDLINDLRGRPDFLEQYQVAVFHYPTGLQFLRTAAIFRRSLREVETTFDPQRRDPGLQNVVLVGHSMGGLVSKLQATSSGDAFWKICSTRPLDSLITSESSRAKLRDVFFFEPLPFVRRIVFIGTPHDGAALANRTIGRVTSRRVQRPEDSIALVQQLERDNPGAILPYMADMPSSIDLLSRRGPVLEAMRRLPINPTTTYHTIAGTAGVPVVLARGDGVVPISSAQSDGAASELWVPSVHTRMNSCPETSQELVRILADHLAATYSPAPSITQR